MNPLIFFLGISLLFSAPGTSPQTNAASSKPKIGIMKFEVDTDLKPALSTFLYESFSGEMVASGAFTVVDWEQLDKVQKVVAQAQPNVSPEDARKLALHQMGLEKLYLGSLTKVGSKLYLTVKLLNLDLQVERSERLPVASEDDLEPAVIKLAKMLSSSPEQAKAIKAQLERQKAETDRWAEVQKNESEESLAAFLKEFPDGVMAVKAKKALEAMRGKTADREKSEELARQAQAQDLEKRDQLHNIIAGRWFITSEPVQVGANHQPYRGVPGGVVNILQQGTSISFEGLYGGLFGYAVMKSPRATTYSGTYVSGTLKARCEQGAEVNAMIDESGKKLIGDWSTKRYSGKLEMTRGDPDRKP